MGTKNNPGKFDCYDNAGPDEPMFVLLARDRHAELLTRLWAMLRLLDDEDMAVVTEAVECACAMQRWRIAHRGFRGVHIGGEQIKAIATLLRGANVSALEEARKP